MDAAKPYHVQCVVVSPERALFDEPADFVALPMYDGEMGVLPGRAPLIGRLGSGELRVRNGKDIRRFFVDGGFVQIRDNVVTVLTARALKAEEIQPEAAQKALAEAQATQHRAHGPEAQQAALAAQDKARAQLRIAEHTEAAAHGEHA
jgi:F-type H+-transporting ATPase subunit epsilon